MIQNELGVFFKDIFSDKRIDSRATKLLSTMIANGSSVVNQCCSKHTEKIGAYRMLNNVKCSEEKVKQSLYNSCLRNTESQHLLCIQDTTEISYFAHKQRINKFDPNIGRLHDTNIGYFCHPMLAIDAQQNMPIGFCSVKLWNREWIKPNKDPRGYKKLPIEEKETYRWINSVSESRTILPKETIMTVIADRESDIYEALCTIPTENTHLLIRSNSNRILCEDNMRLLDKLGTCEIKHTYNIEIKGNKSRKSRNACIDLRYTNVDIKRTATTIGDYPDSVNMNCIYVVEQPKTVPAGEAPIEWRLYTTHQIDSVEQAMQCVQWYRARWYIEELFRLLKTEGMNIEASQLEAGVALKKMLLFSLQAALQIMILKIAYDQKREDCSAQTIFTDKQIQFMKILLPTLEGKTEKQKNPFSTNTLVWAAWIIARLGRWNGYSSQSPPGYITMKTGLDIFYIQSQAFLITCDAMKDVYKE